MQNFPDQTHLNVHRGSFDPVRHRPARLKAVLLPALLSLLLPVAWAWAETAEITSSEIKPAAADASPGQTSTSLDNISVSSLPGDRLQIKLGMSATPPQPISFTIDNPARITLDFPNTALKLAQKSQAINLGLANNITAVEAKGRTRVVLSLDRLVAYETRIDGNDVYLTLEPDGIKPSAVAQSTPSSTPAKKTPRSATASALDNAVSSNNASGASSSLENVDFRRGEKGEGRVIVSLSDPNASADVREEGGRIVVDFPNSSLPEKLERRLDVTDFATPIKTVETSARGNGTRMVITPAGDYEHLAYQTGNAFTVEVKPLTKAQQEANKKERLGYTGEKLSLNFQSIDVRAVLQLIADFTGLNIVASDTVQGNLTLRLQNVPWDQALDIILESKSLGMRQIGNVIQVAPAVEIAEREKQELEAQKEVAELSPLRSELFQINYAKAADLAALLRGRPITGDGGNFGGGAGFGASTENSLISERGAVTVDERTNTLLIQDTTDKLAELRQLVSTLDSPQRQVLIESRIVLANNDFSKDLGVRFGVNAVEDTDDGIITIGGSADANDDRVNDALDNLQSTGQPFPVGIGALSDRFNVNLPVAASNAGRLALAILGSNFLVDLELSALQQEGRGEIISSPRVVTTSQREALIEQGTEIPFLEASSSGATTISFRPAVLSLRVTPQITPDDRVIMDLTVTQDTVGAVIILANSAVPSIDTREVSTQVLVNNGETVVLGGVYEQENRSEVDRIPFFGDLPYVGPLFRQTRQTNDKSELLIFVTPKIIKDTLGLGR